MNIHNYATAEEKIRRYIFDITDGIPIAADQDPVEYLIASHEALRHLLEIEREKNGNYREGL